MTIGLIASSAYVSSGLMAEFGRIPPCMLPLGGRRLLDHQIAQLGKFVDRLFVALPDDYALSPMDQHEIQREGASVILSPPELTIGEAIANAINTIGTYDEPIVILYGDTLITDLEAVSFDVCSTHPAHDLHDWAKAEDFLPNTLSDTVLSGLFCFSDVPLLLRALASNRGRILNALRLYSQHRQLMPFDQGAWYDFGHVQTYYRSTGIVSTARAFNDVQISGKVVLKSSNDSLKMDAEARWFEECPDTLRGYLPAFLGRFESGGRSGYRTSHTFLSTLSNLAVFGRLSTDVWQRIFAACSEFLDAAAVHRAPSDLSVDPVQYYGAKTEKRLALFADQGLVRVDFPLELNGRATPSALQMGIETAEIIKQSAASPLTFIHGDFCFSNIFFDFRSDAIRVIDPRGILPDGRISHYGDPRYDVAKLAHSVVSNYDLIVAGRITCMSAGQKLTFDLTATREAGWSAMQSAFQRSGIHERIIDETVRKAIQVQLFLSMLPLHKDRPSRQLAFLAMAADTYLSIGAR